MKGWKYYLLVIPFYILASPFVVICLFAEFWIIFMAVLRLLGIIPLFIVLGLASILEPRLIHDNLVGDTKHKLNVTIEVIKDEFEDTKYFLRNLLILLRESDN